MKPVANVVVKTAIRDVATAAMFSLLIDGPVTLERVANLVAEAKIAMIWTGKYRFEFNAAGRLIVPKDYELPYLLIR